MPKTKTKTAKRTAKPVTAIATRPTPAPGDEQMTAIERYVLDPRVDVEKLERVIALQERARSEASRVAFFAALSPLQASLPKIRKRGKICKKGGGLRNRYSKMGDDILPVIKPLMAAAGFAIRWRTEFFSDEGKRMIRVVGILTYALGWSEESVFEAPPDTHDSRNHVQSLGSTISYGHRYTMVDLLNLEMADDVDVHDDDGQGATGRPPASAPPKRAQAADVLVSTAQLGRLYTIADNSKRSKGDIKAWLAVAYNLKSSKDIKLTDYDGIIAAIESPGPLPAREPGEEG